MTVTQKLNKLKYSKTLAFLLCVSIYILRNEFRNMHLTKYAIEEENNMTERNSEIKIESGCLHNIHNNDNYRIYLR